MQVYPAFLVNKIADFFKIAILEFVFRHLQAIFSESTDGSALS
jgi:hypothetical protein